MTRIAAAADRLAAGSIVLARRIGTGACAWCARARRDDLTGLRAILGNLLRAGLLVLGAYTLARVVRAVPALMWVLTAGWTIAAWRAGKAPTSTAVEPEEEAPPARTGNVREATLEWIWQRIGDRQGVHLRDLLAHARAHGMFEGLEVAELRAHLERWGIPVRSRCRVRGLGVTVGIHRDDLEAVAGPSPAAVAQDAA